MVTNLPSVQKNCKHIHIVYRAESKHTDKRNANRRFRRVFEQLIRDIEKDPELWDDEAFELPTHSNWDID
jgi:hypothetical protein